MKTLQLSYFKLTSITLGLCFLYIPILILIIYSFNASKLVTVWGGFSLRWYLSLWSNASLLNATWTSIKVALLSASLSTVLGTLAALALTRYSKRKRRTSLSTLIYAPLILPEVIVGLALLLFFVALNWERGALTIACAHTTLTLCFVTILVQSRLLTLDKSLEEAAIDLGCPPLKTFFHITLPLIFPAILAGFLLAFTLSLDDIVLASFTSGPGATTLSMRIYSQLRLGITPEINAVCTLLILFITLSIGFISLATKGKFFLNSH